MKNENLRKAKELFAEKRYEDAHRLFLEAAEEGSAEAMYNLSWDYYDGTGVGSDIMQAWEWIKRAYETDPLNDKYAGRRNTLADLSLGIKAFDSKDYERAFRYLNAAAEQKDRMAMYQTAFLLANGLGTEKDEEKAIQLLKELLGEDNHYPGAEQLLADILINRWDGHTDPSAIISLLDSYLEKGTDNADQIKERIDQIRMTYEVSDLIEKGNYEEAAALLQERVRRGWDPAIFRLAKMRYEGLTDTVSDREAFESVKALSEKGFTPAYPLLSEMYITGRGAEQDLSEAERWLKLAQENDAENTGNIALKLAEAKKNNDRAEAEHAENSAADLYNAGQYEEAFRHYLKAAELGSLTAMRDVSVLYANGIGSVKDPETAFCWMKKAADEGLVSANTDLAKMYCYGIGTPTDYEKAIEAAEYVLEKDPADPSASDILKYARSRIAARQLSAGEMLDRGSQLYRENRMEEAFSWFLKAAEAGNRIAMTNAGIGYLNGTGTAKNIEKGLQWVKRAAAEGDAFACNMLADFFLNGNYVMKDLAEAEKWSSRSAELDPQNPNYRKKLEIIRNAVNSESGRSRELVDRGVVYVQQNNYPAAFQCFHKAAMLGDPAGMNNLSVCYINGQGVDKSEKLAFEWMKKAAENGFSGSFGPLSDKYFIGSGTEIDISQAVNWAEKACHAFPQDENSRSRLQFISSEAEMLSCNDPSFGGEVNNRGLLHIQQGEKKNAFLCFRKAAELNEPSGMHNLALCFAQGDGTYKDSSRAFEWMKRSAALLFPLSCYELAGWYYDGYITVRNLDEARRWAEEACRLDPQNKDFQNLLDRINQASQQAGTAGTANNGFKEPVPVLITGADLRETEELIRKGEQLRSQERYDEAVICFEQAGKRGHYKALRHLGEMLYAGEGVEKNLTDASMFLNAAALRGDEYAEDFLCKKFSSGIYVNDWKIKAYVENRNGSEDNLRMISFTEGCRETVLATETDDPFGYREPGFKGNPDALCRLGNIFNKPKDKIPALTNAAIAGHSHAMFMLGGYFKEIDKETSEQFYREAAKRGNTKAQAFISFGNKY